MGKRRNAARADIAEFWFSPLGKRAWKSAPWKVAGIESPSCFACSYVDVDSGLVEAPSWRAMWNRSRLERAHVVGLESGGTNDLANFILLCGRGHREHPKTRDPADTFRWMDARVTIWTERYEVVTREATRLGLDLNGPELSAVASDPVRIQEALRELGSHPVEHGSEVLISASGVVALLKRLIDGRR